MSVFDFISDAGDKLFGSDEEKSEQIQDAIEKELGSFISDLSVEYSDGVVNLGGVCENDDVYNRAVNIAGDYKGVEQVDAEGLVVSDEDSEGYEDEDSDEGETYTVKAGDTLSKIAKKFYGDASRYPEIFEANRDILDNPNMIKVGQVLIIP